MPPKADDDPSEPGSCTPGSTPNKWVALVASCYMCVTSGGLMYGWPSLLLMLQADNEYKELCHGQPAPCDAQDAWYHWVWTVSSAVCLASSLATGLLLDALGPRVCATVCAAGVLVGCLCIGFSNSQATDLLLPGMILISAFGPGVQNACVHVSNLFERRSTASSCIIGAFNLSYAVFLLLEVAHRCLGASRRGLFLGYSALVLASMLLAFLVMPSKPFGSRSPDALRQPLTGSPASEGGGPPGRALRHQLSSSPQAAAATLAVGRTRRETLITIALSEAPLHHQVVSSPFLCLLIWTTISIFWLNFYIGTVASRLGHGGSVQIVGEELREEFIELFNLLSPAGVLFLPVIGHVFDRVSFALGLFLTNLFGALFAGLLLFPSRVTLVAAWLCYTLYRNCAFAAIFATLTHYLGFANLGVLVGLTLLVSGAASLCQPLVILLITLDLHGSYQVINYCQFGSMLVLFFFPLWSFVRERRMKHVDSADSITIAVTSDY